MAIATAGEHIRYLPEGTEQVLPVRSIIIHEKYDNPTGVNDIALLVLKTPIKFTDRIKAIRIPGPNQKLPGKVMSMYSKVSIQV